MKISACVIAKNEAHNIGQCLESIKCIVDEIIIVDTGSTDDTVAVAKSYGAKIYHYQWQDNFALAKNFALDKAKGDWIIFLDADEYFTLETVNNVPKAIKKHQHECDGLLTQMVNIDVDKNDKVLDQFFNVRIFRNDPKMRFVGKVHEQICNLNRKKNAWYKINPNEIKLYHTGYSSNVVRRKCERNLKLLLDQMQNNDKDIKLYRYLADTYYGLDEYDQAIKYARLDIATGRKELAYASRPYRLLINALIDKQASFAEIEVVIKQAIEAFPNLPDFYAEYALLLYKYDQYDEVLKMMAEAMRLNENYDDIETNLFNNNSTLTNSLIGLVYENKNDFSNAIEYYRKILMNDKYNAGVFGSLFRIIFREDAIYVIALLNQIYDKTNQVDLEFLIKNISVYYKEKVLAYYLQAKQKLLGTNDIDLLALECTQQYDSIQNIINGELSGKINFMACSAILINDYEQLTIDIQYLPDEYKNIILRFYQIDDIKLSEKEFEVYQGILLGLMRSAEDDVFDKYCDCAKDFELIHMLAIAKILKNNLHYAHAVRLYEVILKCNITEGLGGIAYDVAYSYYKLGNYAYAVKYFEQAIELGYEKNNELQSFFEWSKEQVMKTASEVGRQ